MDVIAYLESKDVQLKQGGNGNVHTTCFFCDEDETKPGRLYINVDPESEKYGLFYCFLCNSSGGINRLRSHFGDSPLEYDSSKTKIFEVASKYYEERLFENPEAYKYLVEERGFNDETIRKARLGWADGGLLPHLLASGFELEDIQATGLINQFGSDFFQDRITIPYLEYGEAVTIRGKDPHGKYLSLPAPYGIARLYGQDAIRGQTTVLLAAGEADALVLNQLGFHAAGVPGENIWKQEWTELLIDAKRIYILFDNDSAGKAGAEKLATKLGPRARVVEMPEAMAGQKKIDVTEWYVGHGKTREDFEFLLSQATGGLLVSVQQAFNRWLEMEGNPNLTGLRFNLPELDNEMQHGLLPGQVVTLLAKSNAGKTLITLNLLHRMLQIKEDLQVLYVSLEQTRNEWFERAHRIHNFYEPGVTTLDTINLWKNNLWTVDKNRITQDELEVCIDQYEYETGRYPDIVVVDYLGYYARGFEGEEYARTTSAIMGLKAIAKARRLVIYAPHQVNRTGDYGEELRADQGKSSGAVEETSDMLLALWSPDQKTGIDDKNQKREIFMKILKSRDGGVGKQMRLQMAPLTLAIVPINDDLYERALAERQYKLAGDDWKQAVYRHKTGDKSVQVGIEG